MDWCDFLKLPQVTQGSEDWLAARCLKQTGSDFAALIPKTKDYVGHIFERWNYTDTNYSSRANCAKSLPKAQYYRKKCLDAIKFQNKKNTKEDELESKTCTNHNGDLEGAMSVGKRFENIIRNATIQVLGTHISEIGWVENLKTPHAGVSPDGIVHCTVYPSKEMKHDKKIDVTEEGVINRIAYGFGIVLETPVNTDLFGATTLKCTRSFEAKTLVSRQCDQRVPLQYHIQVEKNLYELDLQSAIYSEAAFIEMSVEEWERRRLELANDCNINHLRLGCLILHSRLHEGHERYVWPHAYVRTPEQFMEWRDLTLTWYTWKYPDTVDAPPEVIYFEMEKLWITEIDLWSNYTKIYAPLIRNEIEHLTKAVAAPETYLNALPTPVTRHQQPASKLHVKI